MFGGSIFQGIKKMHFLVKVVLIFPLGLESLDVIGMTAPRKTSIDYGGKPNKRKDCESRNKTITFK